MITRHFKNTLLYIRGRKDEAANGEAGGIGWDEIDIAGALLKMGITR